MSRPLRRLAAMVGLLFLALLLAANYVQVVNAKSLRDNPNNHRPLIESYARQRGPIIVGTAEIARSVATKDVLKYLRVYGSGPLYAPVTGYFSLVYGASGIEQADNSILNGQDDRLFVKRISDVLTGRQPQGGAVVLTINAKAQQAAYTALAGRHGAVVALDPRTGAILALATSPSYDPSVLAKHDTKSVTAAWKQLNADPALPMLDRAISQTYPPGSLFKVVTAAAALSSGRYTPSTQVPSPTQLSLPLTTVKLQNFGGESCGNGRTDTLSDAFRISCNTAFGSIGLALGPTVLKAQADRFGFDSKLNVPLPVAPSVFPSAIDKPQTAFSAIGQFDVRISPMQAAMLAATVANHGTLMKPYLVQEVKAPDLSTLDIAKPQVLAHPIEPTVADQLTAMMELVVSSGTGTAAQIPGITVAGKTGTAQHGTGARQPPPHAWFIAFAPAQNPQVAVAVVVEDGGGLGSDATGGLVAAPIARSVIEAVLSK